MDGSRGDAGCCSNILLLYEHRTIKKQSKERPSSLVLKERKGEIGGRELPIEPASSHPVIQSFSQSSSQPTSQPADKSVEVKATAETIPPCLLTCLSVRVFVRV